VALWVIHLNELHSSPYGYVVFFTEGRRRPYRHLLTRLVHDFDAHPLAAHPLAVHPVAPNLLDLVSWIRDHGLPAVDQEALPIVVPVRSVLFKQE
jgi:hypothetical protein